MFNEIFELILASMEGSFLQVTVFVGAVLMIFNYINFKTKGAFIESIKNAKNFQPVIGALLGLTPGCGGAIFVMPLFIKGNVTFGTVIATLIATMGDAAFVMIAAMPLHYLWISVLSFVAAIITGYIVDYLKIGDKLLANMEIHNKKELEALHAVADHMILDMASGGADTHNHDNYKHVGHDEGDIVDLALHHNAKGHQDPNSLGHRFTHSFYRVYWVFIALGLVLGVMLLFQMDVNTLIIPNLGLYIGVIGTLVSAALMIMGKKFLADDTHEESEIKMMSLKETFIHGAQETAFVGTWVFVAYLIYEIGVFAMGGGDYGAGELIMKEMMMAAGLYSVILGAVIGLVPGCGPQIIFVALFTKGMVPFAAVLANAISQDGDALFPLLAIDRKSSLWATVITTVPAFVFGIVFYYLEVRFGWFMF
jgi:hypothetical protein